MHRTRINSAKIYMTENCQSKPEEKEQSWRLPDFRQYYKAW